MGSEKDRTSDHGEEEISSDFFDDFTKDDFMEGLSVIDSWDDVQGAAASTGSAAPSGSGKRRDSRRINVEALDNVKDLRELIGDNKEAEGKEFKEKRGDPSVKFNDKYKWRKRESQDKSSSDTRVDDFIKPGSRRDPNKTNEAIKKDKEVKVKEYLAKHLDSTDDLRPPGTELDDYFDEEKSIERKKTPRKFEEPYPEKPRRPSSKDRSYRDPPRHRSPRRYSPRRRLSPQRWSPRRSPTRQSRRFSPQRNFRSRYSPRRSPRRLSPSRHRQPSPRARRRSSRSPRRRSYDGRRSRSPVSRSPRPDSFLYPNDPEQPSYPRDHTYHPEPGQMYTAPVPNEFSGVPGYSYSLGMSYSGGYSVPYNYGSGGVLPAGLPGPVLAPAPPLNPVPAPSMVPAPTVSILEQKTPYDALAQLVAEGKISQEDYLKLAPNKGASSIMDSKSMGGVMSRCTQALTKLDKLLLPSHLMMNNHIIGSEPKSLESKFCSPLKRQAVIEFNFTKTSTSMLSQQNKQLVESIINTIGLDKMISKYKKKLPKDTKDAAVQTTKPFCDVCEIRESTKYQEAGTSADAEHFMCTVHTQVVEQDLVNSKSIFNPTGSVGDGAPISIAHLTPAQLVSQLAARAKTLKQTSPGPPPVHQTHPQHQNQYARRNPNYDYDGRGGGGNQQYHNYNNYRY